MSMCAEEIEIEIERMTHGSAGVSRNKEGKTVFIEGVCPKDKVRARITACSKNYDRAELVEVLEPSPNRVRDSETYPQMQPCCPWQQIEYDMQLKAKAENVISALVRIGHLDEKAVREAFLGINPSKRQWGYRNKAEFEVGSDEGGRLLLGVRTHDGSFAPLKTFPLLPKRYAKTPHALQGALRYLQGNANLGIRRVGIRVSENTGSIEVSLWTETGAFPRKAASSILPSAAWGAGCVRVMLKGERGSRKTAGVEVISGKGFWTEELHGFRMMISAPSFFQTNTAGAVKLIDLVSKWLQPAPAKTILDLYSGAGTFTLPLSASGADVVAIESQGSSVSDLRRNLEANGLYADVIGGDVAREMPRIGHVDGAVVDPPRCGLSKDAIRRICDLGAERLVYISCDPASLGRDLSMLAGSYELRSIECADLFPQTYHVESVCLMSRRDA